ncbi:unnamed protein product [Cylindrotheca closterium]|uniref:DUF1995 domain-containing protein n=1 Tax=Cylindrotheca closterium TaxID=2856 RepID=A0AAD2FTU4_9STRA|nr:unnamed protein product [Cylindrotheca closterium]
MVKITSYLLIIILAVLLNGSCAFMGGQWWQTQGRVSTPPSDVGRSFQMAVTSSNTESRQTLDEKQIDFTRGYLNKHHTDFIIAVVETFSELGAIKSKKNAWSGGSYVIADAKLVDIDPEGTTLEIEASIKERKNSKVERVSVDLNASPVTKTRSPFASMEVISNSEENPIDDLVRRLNRFCWIVNKPAITGKLIQLGIKLGGDGVGEIKENLFLNQVPHNRYVRKYFYEMAANATLEAVALCSEGKISNRMKLISMFPEMNPAMDSYRIGTILEMARTIAIKLVEQNLRVRICVQGSMGVGIFTAVPKQLNGVSKLLQMMDWQAEAGEENEGMIGNYLNFGAVGKEHVVNAHTAEDGTKVEQDDVFLIIAPQSMVGVDSSIIPALTEMVDAAGDRPVILMNPDLVDKVSSQGQQNVRGRQQRIDFANSFKTIHQFQNIYVSGTSYFPILGSMTKISPLAPWVAHQRRDLANDGGEIYIPVLASEYRPDGEVILESFAR